MVNFSKFNDIEAVMNKASSSLYAIEQEYSKYLKEEKIPDDFLVEIKDYLGNLRTALDYVWYKIPSVSDGYFPITNSEADFFKKTTKIDTQHVSVLKKYQDYDSNSWIRCFNLFRNKNSHVTLIPQKKVETPMINIEHNGVGMRLSGGSSIQIGQGSSISLGGAVIYGGQTISPNSNGLIGDPRLNIKKVIWVDFIFDGSAISSDFPINISALPFLKDSLKNVKKIIAELEQVL